MSDHPEDDPFADPASLWPDPPPADGEEKLGKKPLPPPPPRRWVWEAMAPDERRQRLRELGEWVAWLRRTFELHNQLPPCWYQHPPVVEHLTALYIGWVRTYAAPTEPQGLAEAEWLNTLHALLPRLGLATCAAGTHDAAPIPPRPHEDENFAVYVAAAPRMDQPPRHPATAEMRRLAKAANPPL